MKKYFTMKIDGEKVVRIEVDGSDEIVEFFVKQMFTDTFGIFYKWKDAFAEMFLNGIKVKMSTVFRREDGKFISPKEIADIASKP